MTITELRAMLEVLTEEDFRAAMPLERCNNHYVRMMDRVKELEEDLARAERLQKATEEVRDQWFEECRRQAAQLVFLRKDLEKKL